MAFASVTDAPNFDHVILYVGPFGDRLGMVYRVPKDWLCNTFPYFDRMFGGQSRKTFAYLPEFPGQTFAYIVERAKDPLLPLRAAIGNEGGLHYWDMEAPTGFPRRDLWICDPITLYAWAEKLEHTELMRETIDRMEEFSQNHDALPHESVIELAYKRTKRGSHLRRYLLRRWGSALARRGITGPASQHVVDCINNETLRFDIRYLKGVYRGLKVSVLPKASTQPAKFCHCATCENKSECPMCIRRDCEYIGDGQEGSSLDLSAAFLDHCRISDA
jgi:hypothetical protein